jgi:hypothetical protein
MKRIVKEYAVRSDEILDAAQQFVRKGSRRPEMRKSVESSLAVGR